MQKTGLGKGLGALFPRKAAVDVLPPQSPVAAGVTDAVVQAPTAAVSPNPQQPRRDFAEAALDDLKASIRAHGIVQPLIVTRIGDRYQLIAGERRWRAAKALGLATVPVIVRAAERQHQLELALVENLQRADLNAIEEAVAYQRLVGEFNLSQETLAQRVGKSRPAIANTLRLLSLPEEIQRAVASDKIPASAARVIAGLPSEQQLPFYRRMVKSGLAVSAWEVAARKINVRAHTRTVQLDPQTAQLVERLQQALGTKVRIARRGEAGTVAISFYSLEELRALVEKMTRGRT